MSERRPTTPGAGPSSVSGTLTNVSDVTLLARARDDGDTHARDLMVERYLPLARQLARRYQRAEEPLDDLVQVASVGLLKAVDRFDTSRDVAFSSYAVPTILGELKRHFRDRTWSLRVPRELQEMVLRTDAAVARMAIELHRQPTVAEIANALSSSEEQVLEALSAAHAYRAGSLDAPRAAGVDAEDGVSLGESLGVADDGFQGAEDRATLGPLFARLTKRERLVLQLRFGEDLTQSEIGERIGVSQMQVSRMIRQALTRLRATAT